MKYLVTIENASGEGACGYFSIAEVRRIMAAMNTRFGTLHRFWEDPDDLAWEFAIRIDGEVYKLTIIDAYRCDVGEMIGYSWLTEDGELDGCEVYIDQLIPAPKSRWEALLEF